MLTRRKSLQIAAGAFAMPTILRSAWAQAYPSRPVRMIVGFAAGGVNDVFGRLIADWLSKQLGHSFIVENRPGATGNIGLESVVRAAPDGYTLSVCGSTELRNELLYSDLKFSFMRDTAPVATIFKSMNVLVVNPSLPVRSVPELIAAARAKPDAMTVASAGPGSTQHIFWEMFRSMTGTRMLHVPYRGGAPATTDQLAGQVQVQFSTMSDALEHVKAGKLRALAVTSAARSAALPDVPTIGEFVPGYEAVGWLAIVAPKDTPTTTIEVLNRAVNAGLTDSTIEKNISGFGLTPFASSPAEFGKFIAAENEKWGRVIRTANIKAE